MAFSTADREFTYRDVLEAAAVRGDLAPVVEWSAALAASAERAAAEGMEPEWEQVEARIDGFRYDHELVTAEETERWLEQRGLTVEDLSDHFTRLHWHERLGGMPESGRVVSDGSGSDRAADLLISGSFDRLAVQLAREVAAAARQESAGGDPAPDLLAAWREERALDDGELEAWLQGSGLTGERLLEFLRLRHLWERERNGILTRENRAALLAEQRVLLTRVEVETLEFESETAAKEARWCATSDGIGLEELAGEIGYALRRKSGFLRDFPEAWRLQLGGALPNQLLPMLSHAGAFHLCRVLRHKSPQIEDPAVVAELDALLMQRRLGDVQAGAIRWPLPGEAVR